MRASIDWPHCPTTTRSSTRPARNGPKMSSQGGGRELSGLRNVVGIRAQEEGPELTLAEAETGVPFSSVVRSSSRPAGVGRRPSVMVHDLLSLSKPVPPCHDIWVGRCLPNACLQNARIGGNKPVGAAFLLFMV